jgi:hypothetical protein
MYWSANVLRRECRVGRSGRSVLLAYILYPRSGSTLWPSALAWCSSLAAVTAMSPATLSRTALLQGAMIALHSPSLIAPSPNGLPQRDRAAL